MNDLSWLLYMAGVLPQLAIAVAVISVIGVIMFLTVLCVYLVCRAENNNAWKTFHPYRHGWIVCVTMFILTFTVPDKETFYAIVVSEMGEEVLKSDVGTKATKALEVWLDKQLEEQQQDAEE